MAYNRPVLNNLFKQCVVWAGERCGENIVADSSLQETSEKIKTFNSHFCTQTAYKLFLQTRFADFVQQIDKIKFVLQKALGMKQITY